jgi:hypothetical protein
MRMIPRPRGDGSSTRRRTTFIWCCVVGSVRADESSLQRMLLFRRRLGLRKVQALGPMRFRALKCAIHGPTRPLYWMPVACFSLVLAAGCSGRGSPPPSAVSLPLRTPLTAAQISHGCSAALDASSAIHKYSVDHLHSVENHKDWVESYRLLANELRRLDSPEINLGLQEVEPGTGATSWGSVYHGIRRIARVCKSFGYSTLDSFNGHWANYSELGLLKPVDEFYRD